jgi:hypothetical protein
MKPDLVLGKRKWANGLKYERNELTGGEGKSIGMHTITQKCSNIAKNFISKIGYATKKDQLRLYNIPLRLSCHHNSLHAVVVSIDTGARESFGF